MKPLEWGPLIGVSFLFGIVIALSVSLPIVYRHPTPPSASPPVESKRHVQYTRDTVRTSAIHSEHMSGGRLVTENTVTESIVKLSFPIKQNVHVIGLLGRHGFPHVGLGLGIYRNMYTHTTHHIELMEHSDMYFFEYHAQKDMYVWAWLSSDGNAIYLAHSAPHHHSEWIVKNIGLSRTVSHFNYANLTACVDEMCMRLSETLDEYVWLPSHSLHVALPVPLPNGGALYLDAAQQRVGIQRVMSIDWSTLRVTLQQSIFMDILVPSHSRVQVAARDSFLTHPDSKGTFFHVTLNGGTVLKMESCAGVNHLGLSTSLASYSCGNTQFLRNLETNRVISYNTLQHAIQLMQMPFSIAPAAVPH